MTPLIISGKKIQKESAMLRKYYVEATSHRSSSMATKEVHPPLQCMQQNQPSPQSVSYLPLNSLKEFPSSQCDATLSVESGALHDLHLYRSCRFCDRRGRRFPESGQIDHALLGDCHAPGSCRNAGSCHHRRRGARQR